jgi:NAD(P)-dependent dehydrogenase (short-subunit alcohol dehydrogenase family)
MNQFDLSGRAAVVTGAAEGFGRAMTERFLASGARVSLWDRHPERLRATADKLSGLGTVHTARAGVVALTRSLGKELAQHDIAVNCITPAAARTRIFDQMTQAHLDFMLSRIPRGRFLKIEELASLATWLASEENSFSTGAVWDTSGGRSVY